MQKGDSKLEWSPVITHNPATVMYAVCLSVDPIPSTIEFILLYLYSIAKTEKIYYTSKVNTTNILLKKFNYKMILLLWTFNVVCSSGWLNGGILTFLKFFNFFWLAGFTLFLLCLSSDVSAHIQYKNTWKKRQSYMNIYINNHAMYSNVHKSLIHIKHCWETVELIRVEKAIADFAT